MNESDHTGTLASGRSVLRIGRAEDNDVVLDDSLVSRYHVELRRSTQGWEVLDLGSRNGTILNGVRVRSAEAEFGGTLRLGHTEIALDAGGPRLLNSPITALDDAARTGKADGSELADGAAAASADTLVTSGPAGSEHGDARRTKRRWVGIGAAGLFLAGLVFVIESGGNAEASGDRNDPLPSAVTGEIAEASEGGSIAPYVPGVDQWPDGTRVDFKEGAKQQFSQWHMDEAIANWYPNQASICETVTVDGPLTLVRDIVDFYEGTAQAFGGDAYSIGWATAILAVDHCPNAYFFVADKPQTDARTRYEAAKTAAADRAAAEAAEFEEEEQARLEAQEAEREALFRAQEKYWEDRAEQIAWDSAVCETWRTASSNNNDASADEVTRFWNQFGEGVDYPNYGNPWDRAMGMLADKCWGTPSDEALNQSPEDGPTASSTQPSVSASPMPSPTGVEVDSDNAMTSAEEAAEAAPNPSVS